MQRSKQEEESHHLRLEVKAGGELKQQVQFRFGQREPLGMISLHYWTGGYIIPVCGSSWVTDIM